MKATLTEFRIRLKHLLDYLNHVEQVRKTLQENPQGCGTQTIIEMYSSPRKKIYDYNLAIITLYGVFENFNEQIVQSYLKQLNLAIHEYIRLPPKLLLHHIPLSASLIISASSQQKYSDIKPEKVIENLNSCCNCDSDYSLNVEAFTQHGSNFRLETLRDFYNRIGVENIVQGIGSEPIFIHYQLLANAYSSEEIAKTPDSILFFELEDLVERRNKIAHGAESDDLLEINLLRQYVFFMQALMESIYGILDKIYHRFLFQENPKKLLGQPIKVYNNEIVCLNSQGCVIKENDILYGLNTSTEELRYGEIVSIERDHVPISSTILGEACNIGMKVDFHAKEGYNYYILEL